MSISSVVMGFVKENFGDILIEMFSFNKIKDMLNKGKRGSTVIRSDDSEKAWFNGLFTDADEGNCAKAMAELPATKQAKINKVVAALDHNQKRRFRVLVAWLRSSHVVLVEEKEIPTGQNDGNGNPIFQKSEIRTPYDPSVKFLTQFAKLSKVEKREALDVLGVLTGDSEWVAEQKAKMKEVVEQAKEETINLAEGFVPVSRQIFFRTLTLGIWGGPKA